MLVLKKISVKQRKKPENKFAHNHSVDSRDTRLSSKFHMKQFVDLIRVENLTYGLSVLSKAEKLSDVMKVSLDRFEEMFSGSCKIYIFDDQVKSSIN